MTPEESSARLSLYTEPGTWVLGKYDIRAIQQGIEALGRIKRIRDLPEEVRSMYPKECFELLPGETELVHAVEKVQQLVNKEEKVKFIPNPF